MTVKDGWYPSGGNDCFLYLHQFLEERAKLALRRGDRVNRREFIVRSSGGPFFSLRSNTQIADYRVFNRRPALRFQYRPITKEAL